MHLKQTVRRCASQVSLFISTSTAAATRSTRRSSASPDTPPPLRLPQEIVDAIIDQLASDIRSLTSVGLVSWLFYPRTRDHLFGHIRLGERYPQTSSRRLLALLQQRPALASYIRELTLYDNADPYERRESWLKLCHYTIQLLPYYTSLTHLRIICKSGVDWRTLPLALQAGLYDVMARPTFVHLSLARVQNVDYSQLARFTHIEDLSLESVLMEPGGQTETNHWTCLPAPRDETPYNIFGGHGLQRLELIDCGDALERLLRYTTAANFRLEPKEVVVGTRFNDSMRRVFPIFVDLCGSTIESYTVHQPFKDHICAEPFIFSHLHRLRDLKLIVPADSFIDNSHLLIDELSRMCNSQSSSQLVTFTLRLEIARGGVDRVVSRMMEYHAKVNAAVWMSLDAILSSPTFPTLGKVSIEFGVSNCAFSPDYWEKTQHRVESHMPGLSGKRGIVQMSLSRKPPAIAGRRL